MNAFDETYIFRLANTNDIDGIMQFIKDEWGSDTILATSKACLCFQYQVGDVINFILAINKNTGQIESISGFVQYSEKLLDIGPAVWVSKQKTAMPFLGVETIYRMLKITNCRFWGAPGANDISSPIFAKIFKQEIGLMKHFYMLSDCTDFKIAVINHMPKKKKTVCGFVTNIRQINQIQELEGRFSFEYDMNRMPYKDAWFFHHRYFNHPVYDYIIWALEDKESNYGGVMVAREVGFAGKKALKIIDYLGRVELISGLSAAFESILRLEKYEYIDLYCAGIQDEILNQAGFTLRTTDDTNIIPNYFEPFAQKNIDIQYNSSQPCALFFRGDSDRDRPYIWREKC